MPEGWRSHQPVPASFFEWVGMANAIGWRVEFKSNLIAGTDKIHDHEQSFEIEGFHTPSPRAFPGVSPLLYVSKSCGKPKIYGCAPANRWRIAYRLLYILSAECFIVFLKFR